MNKLYTFFYFMDKHWFQIHYSEGCTTYCSSRNYIDFDYCFSVLCVCVVQLLNTHHHRPQRGIEYRRQFLQWWTCYVTPCVCVCVCACCFIVWRVYKIFDEHAIPFGSWFPYIYWSVIVCVCVCVSRAVGTKTLFFQFGKGKEKPYSFRNFNLIEYYFMGYILL